MNYPFLLPLRSIRPGYHSQPCNRISTPGAKLLPQLWPQRLVFHGNRGIGSLGYNSSVTMPNESTLKRCSACKNSLPLMAFSKNRTKPDGLQNNCKACQTKQVGRYFKTDVGRKTKQRYSKSEKGRLSRLRYNQSDYGKKHKNESKRTC